MAGKRRRIPKYGTVEIKGHTYYRTTITDSEGKQRTLYAKTCEELYDKELDALSQLDDDRQRRKSPTVADYCEKWLVMQSAHVRTTTLTDYTSKVRRNIIPYMLYPELGEKARNNGHVVYSLDFEVTPHLLRHTYITNLIHASVDPKTVQYLAGHENSRITMDIYAKVKYNRPDDVVKAMTCAFAEWDAS